jgi:oligopeptidase B
LTEDQRESGLERATSSGGKFDKNNYIEERVWASARWYQGANLYGLSKDMEKNGENPLLLYAYGSAIIYGCLFSTTRLSL